MIAVQRLFAPALVALVLGVAGCGGDEESGDAPAPAATTSTASEPAAAEGGSFEDPAVAFTFSYPEDLQRVDEDDGKQLALLTPDPNDVKSGIKINKIGEQAQPFESYIDSFEKQFEADLDTDVEQRREEHGGFPMGVLEWTDELTYQDLGQEETTELKSTSYFFVGGGKSWQIECLSDPERRDAIEAACAQILETIAPVE